jgi:uncharacterized lipoprotein YmbA
MNFKPILIFLLLLTACATPHNNLRFYSLANTALARDTAENVQSAAPVAIEVLPVNVPERLKRPQLVINSSNTAQLKILEQDRWSSTFNDELQDAFVSGLTQQLNAIDISRGGRVPNQSVYRIAIVLQQFTATPGDQVNANFGWTITRLDATARENKALSCQATFSKPVGNNVNEVVKGIQATVTETTMRIAASVNSLNHGEAGRCTS